MKAEKGWLNLAFRLSFRNKNGANPDWKGQKKCVGGECVVFG